MSVNTKTSAKSGFPLLGRLLHITSSGAMWVVTVIISLGLLLSSWGGLIDPETDGRPGVVVMTLPGWIPAMLLIFVINMLWFRRQAVVAGVVLALCLPRVADTYPLGLGLRGERAGESDRAWTLLTYNCAGGIDLTGLYKGDVNPTYRVIMDSRADVVCLQEWDGLQPYKGHHLYTSQIDSLRMRYPYIIEGPDRTIMLSRYPARPIDLDFKGHKSGYGEMAAYKIDMGSGRELVIFNVHLQSIGLTNADKQLYDSLTEPGTIERQVHADAGDAQELLGRVRYELAAKLSAAGRVRAGQAKILAKYIKEYGQQNVIVCGDFNDVPGCYTLGVLESLGLRQVYSAVGRGYMSTFNRNKFWFRIDHVLWRGDMWPRGITRKVTPTSDHYPVMTRFVWKQ